MAKDSSTKNRCDEDAFLAVVRALPHKAERPTVQHPWLPRRSPLAGCDRLNPDTPDKVRLTLHER